MGWPAIAQNAVAASEYTSAAGVAGRPSRISGAAYGMDALIRPSEVSKPPLTLAMPKSANSGSPNWEMSTFDGLTSRCRTPARCAVSSAPLSRTA